MQIIKSDWAILREAESEGLAVAMTSMVERFRTELNNELSDYFKEKMPNYQSSWNDDEAEDVLSAINEYLEENKIDKQPIDFPIVNGTDIYLIPITANIQLKIVVADNYYGGGDYEAYVMIDFFTITQQATTSDVDSLIDFINKYLPK